MNRELIYWNCILNNLRILIASGKFNFLLLLNENYQIQEYMNYVQWWNLKGSCRYGGGNSTTAEEVSRFKHLFPNPQLVDARKDRHPVSKNPLQYSWIDNCLMVTGPLVVELALVKWHRRFVRTQIILLTNSKGQHKLWGVQIKNDSIKKVFLCVS